MQSSYKRADVIPSNVTGLWGAPEPYCIGEKGIRGQVLRERDSPFQNIKFLVKIKGKNHVPEGKIIPCLRLSPTEQRKKQMLPFYVSRDRVERTCSSIMPAGIHFQVHGEGALPPFSRE